MDAKNKNINWWKVVFVMFAAAYASLMLINANLGPVDDVALLRTLQAGKPLLYYSPGDSPYGYGDVTKLGRFTVLGIMEYNLFGLFSKSPSAFWYFLFHAFQYVLLMALFIKILSQFTSNKYLIYLTPLLLSLIPGMAITFFRTHIMERNVIFYDAVFLACFLLYLKKRKLGYLIFGVISANMAIHYKETAFIALGAFAFSHLLLSWKKSQPKADPPLAEKLGLNPVRSKTPEAFADTLAHRTSNGVKIFDGLTLLGCLAYLFLYYFIVIVHLPANPVLYGQTPYSVLVVIIKNLLNYGLFTDPVLILILLPFTARRLYKAIRRQLELHPVYDSMLIAATMHVLAYFVLRMFSPVYLLPAYIFALPPLIYFFSPVRSKTPEAFAETQAPRTSNGVSRREQRTFFKKGVAAVVGIALLLNVVPAGIHYLTYYKYLPMNFNKTLDFLAQDINNQYPLSGKRTDIFIDSVKHDANLGIAVYFIFEEFLQYRGLSSKQFDLKSTIKTENKPVFNDKNFSPPFTIFQDINSHEILKGDYLVITPESTEKNIDKSYIQSLNKDYKLLFETKSPLAFPSLNLKTLVKYILAKRLTSEQKKAGLMINENLMQWPDYYVFVKR